MVLVFGRLAQLEEHLAYIQSVVGSNPSSPTHTERDDGGVVHQNRWTPKVVSRELDPKQLNFGPVVQPGRTPAPQAGCHGFKSHRGPQKVTDKGR